MIGVLVPNRPVKQGADAGQHLHTRIAVVELVVEAIEAEKINLVPAGFQR